MTFLDANKRHRTGIVALVLAIASLARLYHLRNSPGWYHDETIFLGQAWNLIHGHFQWDSVRHTFLPHLPLYHVLLGPLLLLFGKDILGVRMLSAVCGIAMTWLIYRIGREMGNTIAAITGALFFALCPYTLLLTRQGFTYTVAALFATLNLYFLLRHMRSPLRGHSLFYASAAAGLGLLVTPVMGAPVVATLTVAILTVPPARTFKMAIVMLLPLALYVGLMLLFEHDIFLEDTGIILAGRIGTSASGNVLSGFFDALRGYAYLGLAGLFFLPAGAGRRLLLWMLILDMLLPVKLGDDSFMYRVTIIVTPILLLSLGCLADEMARRLMGWARQDAGIAVTWWTQRRHRMVGADTVALAQKTGSSVMGVIGVCILGALLLAAYREILNGFPSMYRHYQLTTVHHTEAAERTVQWLQPQLKSDDLVITTHLEWMLNCRSVSPMLVQLAEGGSGSNVYFEGLKKRFLFPCRLKDARFAILHEASPRIASVYGVTPILRRIETEWKLVHQDETIRVYANPVWGSGS